MSTETKTAGRLSGKYLTFYLQAESYGIDVLKVREIIRLAAITRVPQMPAYIRGAKITTSLVHPNLLQKRLQRPWPAKELLDRNIDVPRIAHRINFISHPHPRVDVEITVR
jgi:hypothetical protein